MVALVSVLAALIIARQPGNRVGWLLMVSAFGLANPLSTTLANMPALPTVIMPGLWLLAWFGTWSWTLFLFPIFLIPLHFPTGQPLSPRWGWVNRLAIGIWLFFLLITAFSETIGPFDRSWGPLDNPLGFIPDVVLQDPFFLNVWGLGLTVVLLASLASLFVRFHHASSVERQQIKGLLYASVLSAVTYMIIFVFPSQSSWTDFSVLLCILAIFAAIAIAIFRYRLWDIDLIIRRTLQYSLLSGLLGLVYYSGVVLLQDVLTAGRAPQTAEGAVSDQPSAVMIVATTLTIAALFNPLRRRIQDFIDRRFYRQKYDAEQALAEFAAAARSETDLAQLSSRLTATVQETLQPQSMALWIKPDFMAHKRKFGGQGH